MYVLVGCLCRGFVWVFGFDLLMGAFGVLAWAFVLLGCFDCEFCGIRLLIIGGLGCSLCCL